MKVTNLTIVIPAADESANIERCVRSALAVTDRVTVYCMGTADTRTKAEKLGATFVVKALVTPDGIVNEIKKILSRV
jgi:glycosyltransferase involved in cell wall biosynthesis